MWRHIRFPLARLLSRRSLRQFHGLSPGAQRSVSLVVVLAIVAGIAAVIVQPARTKPPTFTFVMVQEGDTLWKLAKRYRAEPEDIIQNNLWLKDQEALSPGSRICIPGRRSESPKVAS